MKKSTNTQTRVFARKVATKLTNDEMKHVSGGSKGGQHGSTPDTPIEQRPAENMN